MLLNYIEQVVSTGFIFFNLIIISLQPAAVDKHHIQGLKSYNKPICTLIFGR